jgi:hypothetical protein
MGRCGPDSSGSGKGPVAGSGVHGDEPVSIKGGVFLTSKMKFFMKEAAPHQVDRLVGLSVNMAS